MTREDIIRMAQECQLIGMRPHLDGIYQESLERFAALVAAAEREALAEQCVCGEPDTPGTHRTDGPCLAEQPAHCEAGPDYCQICSDDKEKNA